MYSFVCKCLNISINTHESLEEEIKRAMLEFEAYGPFQQCQFTNAQSSLVQTVKSENHYSVISCVNCEMVAFAYDEAAKLYWLSTSLLTNSTDITRLKNSENYSKTFKVIVKNVGHNYIEHHIQNNNKPEVVNSPRVKNLRDNLRKALQQDTAATDERIRQYAEQQFQLLKERRSRAEFEMSCLVDVVQHVPEEEEDDDIGRSQTVDLSTGKMVVGILKLSGVGNLDTPPATPDAATPMSIGNSPPQMLSGGNKTPIKYAPNKGIHSSTNKNISLDADDSEYLFAFDGFEEGNSRPTYQQVNQSISDVEESDGEDPSYKGDGSGPVQISRQFGRQASLNIAKSLPISIPDVMSQFRGSDEDDLNEETEDNVDIAASMQKLAKSLHGDAVFGDLPTRPRFTTQI